MNTRQLIWLMIVLMVIVSIGTSASASRYVSRPVGSPVWLPFQPAPSQIKAGGMVHSPRNVEVFEACFKAYRAVSHLKGLEPFLESDSGRGYQWVTRPKGTTYTDNFAVAFIRNDRRNGKSGAWYQVLRCQNSAKDSSFTDYESNRELETVENSRYAISDRTCHNLLIGRDAFVRRTPPAPPAPQTPPTPQAPPAPQTTPTPQARPVPPAPPAPPAEVIVYTAETSYSDIPEPPPVAREERVYPKRRELLQAMPGAAGLSQPVSEQIGGSTLHGGFGLSFGSGQSRSGGHRSGCGCFSCRPHRPTPRTGGFTPPFRGQPRYDPKTGSPPGGTTPPGY